MRTSSSGRPGRPAETGSRPEMPPATGMSARAAAAPGRKRREKWSAGKAATRIGPATAPAEYAPLRALSSAARRLPSLYATSWFRPSTSTPNPRPSTKTATTNTGQVGARATATPPRLTTRVATITGRRPDTRSMARIATSTPISAPVKWTLIVAPARGRLTPNRCVRCSSSGPYAATTTPISRKVAATDAVAVLVRTTRFTGGILDLISDHDSDRRDVGRYAGWGAGGGFSAP